ncbi:transcriptional regulator, Crp/Fnr family [Pseudopedobacter saltans DSM 12145]|uniref:Transcriptional regulator, Crp/Fnr family n=1 Tax=Pseudopedobacter saltans (strain ATCC 51119 / DSM 12145 / JCM 21818 / CCUG 39354 / LMG 10337 / NBRC 100064 / NCIMB 13643) TaxID=762903 RepID=F0S542_PSESL|nr:response regulator [Pseudopedobacter saltans]ADY50959.1 transcriptional regulator, Crp/Fnr family [Pseudopedobacter saltans DSM 12145]
MKNKILIIEDNLDIREGTAEILELAGYEVLTAPNGKAGVEMAQNNLPDLIICDIMMPELDGYGVLYLLGKNPDTASIPFIFLTAKAERIDLRKGMEMGADDYLTKPFDDIELLNAIESRLKKRKQQKDFYSKGLQSLEDFAKKNNQQKELTELISHKKIRNIKKGQVIYYDGDNSQGVYLVLSGSVKIVKLSKDGRELLIDIHHADEYFGIYDALIGRSHSETAEALENSSICLLDKDQVNEMINKHPMIAMQFIHLLAETLKEKDEQLVQLAYHSVRKRLAETLLRINDIHQQSNVFKISRDDLAGMAGMATETVSRTLSDFKEEKLIEKKGSEINLLNIEKLKNLKN